MDRNSPYYKQVALLINCIPQVATETCFALKGGTAINLFVNNFPRLSVDIDLVYLPLEPRDEALKNINSDYEAKRYMNMTINMPRVHKAEKGLFYKWLKTKNKLGGQHKVPRLSNQRVYLEELMVMYQS